MITDDVKRLLDIEARIAEHLERLQAPSTTSTEKEQQPLATMIAELAAAGHVQAAAKLNELHQRGTITGYSVNEQSHHAQFHNWLAELAAADPDYAALLHRQWIDGDRESAEYRLLVELLVYTIGNNR